MSFTVLSSLGHVLLTGVHFLAVFVVIGAGALRMGRRGQRRFALTGSGLLMGLLLAYTLVELATPSSVHFAYTLSMPALVLILSLFFKGSRLVVATGVLACLVSVWGVKAGLTFGLSPMMMMIPLSDMVMTFNVCSNNIAIANI